MASRRTQALINQLFPNDPISQKMALNLAEAYANNPQVGEDRVEALLREGARVNAAVASGELDAQTGLAQLSGFAGTIGTPEHLVNDGMNFLKSGAGLSQEELAALEPPTVEPAQAPPAPQAPAQSAPPAATASPALVDRETLRQTIAKQEANMRAPQGSPEWRAYWKEGGDAECLAARRGLDALTDSIAHSGSVSVVPPVPLQSVPAPAPTATAPTTQAPAAPAAPGAPA